MTPNAICFGPGLRAEGERCAVRVTGSGLAISFPGREASEAVPLARVLVKPGGFDRNRLVLEWTDGGRDRLLYIEDRETIDALHATAPAELRTGLDRALRSMKRTRRGPFVLAVLFLVTAAFLGTALFLTFDALIDQVVGKIPRSWDQALGETAWTSLAAGSRLVESGPAVDAVQEIAGRLAGRPGPAADPVQVTVIKSPVVNAFALPGGRIVVYTGLLAAAENAEELAGVLAHEMSHVTLRHAVKRLVRGAGLSAIVTILLGDQAGMSETARSLGLELVNLSYSREQETEADLEAVRLLDASRISPRGMVTFFEKLSRSETGVVPILSTHPMSAERATRIGQEIAKHPAAGEAPLEVDWGAVRKAAVE